MISFESRGSFEKTEKSIRKMTSAQIFRSLEKYDQQGVNALRNATPTESGLAASSWGYRVERKRDEWSIIWYNTNVENGFKVAIALQYGYGTGTGGYVRGRDYINPAIKPIFDQISREVWKEVTSA